MYLRIVPVVADGHADSAGARLVYRRAGVARGVVALLVEARVFGDVDHPCPSEQTPVGVDDWRAVVRATTIAFEEVKDDDDSKLTGGGHEGSYGRARHILGHRRYIRSSRALRMKGLERQLRKTDE